MLERTVRFAISVDVVLEDYNSCLPKTNNWVLNMFKGALLMISSTLNKIVFSSSN